MDLGIRGKTALVNGGSAGLGKGAAVALAGEGVELFVSSRGEERLMATCEDIRKETGANVTPIVADHSSKDGQAKILSVCPNPDILVGTCSPPPYTPDFREVGEDMWEQYLSSGLLSPISFIKATIDGMIERQFGRIVNISTVATKLPTQMRMLSGAPRAALSNFTVAVARSVARHNVTINNVLPGMHMTAATHDQLTKTAADKGISYEEAEAAPCQTSADPRAPTWAD